jgi:hypothetical protein
MENIMLDKITIIIITMTNLFFFGVLHAEITEVGQCETPGSARGVFIRGDYAFIADREAGLTIIDISDPENPEIVGNFDDYENPQAADVSTVGEVAFISDQYNRLISLDISNFNDINLLDNHGLDDDANQVIVADDIACVTCDSYGLGLFDVSDPEDIRTLSYCEGGASARLIYKKENTIFLAKSNAGLFVIDISDQRNPDTIGSVNTPGTAIGVYVSGDYAYVGDGTGGLQVIDVSDPEDPDIVGNCDFTRASNVFVFDDFAFVLDVTDYELVVVDVSNPEDPEIIESYDTEFYPADMDVIDNYAYIANMNNGLLILDVSDYTHTGPCVELSEDTLDFEAVGLELTAELPLTITNTGNENLTVSDITVEGQYFTTNYAEEFTLEPDEEVELTVSFTPNERGEFEAVLTITSNDEENGDVEVPLYGEGVGAVCWFHPRALEFGVVGIDESSTETISFRNQGLLDLIISDVTFTVGQAFLSDYEDAITLEPDARHTLTVTFTPTEGITYEDTLIFSTNDPDHETVSIPLSGRGMGAVIVVEPDTVQFGDVGRNRSAERVINIRNEGEINLNILEIFVEGRYFSIDLDTVYIVEPEGSLQCVVTFSPTAIGDFRALLFISSDDRQNEEFIIPLYGTGRGPTIAVDSDSLDFGLLRVGESKELILTISAVGLTDLTITDVTVRGAPTFLSAIEDEVFIELNNSFELPVRYNARYNNVLTGVITIHSDDPENGELEIPLKGTAHHGIMIDTLGTISDLTVVNNLAYLATQNGLVVLDVSDPVHPVKTGTYNDEGINALSIFVNGSYAYLSTGEAGFTIVDISIVDSMRFVSSYNTEGYAHNMAVRDGYAYVADGEAGLRVIDLYDLERPEEVSHVDTPGEAYGVTLDGDYAYVADYVHGLRIIDISNPQLPEEIGFYDTRGMSMDVTVSGDFAYVADERYGLRIIDVTDPANPEEIGFYDTDGYAYGVSVAGDHAYIADGSGGMCMLDVSIPESPCPAKIFYTPGTATSLELLDNYAFIADQSDILIINISEFLPVDELNEAVIPVNFILYPAFPNPFNAVTRLSFDLPVASDVSLQVFDLKGRLISTLVDGKKSAGSYSAEWNAKDTPAGIYLVRMEADAFSAVQKVVLVK